MPPGPDRSKGDREREESERASDPTLGERLPVADGVLCVSRVPPLLKGSVTALGRDLGRPVAGAGRLAPGQVSAQKM